MRILICGSRNWKNSVSILNQVKKYKNKDPIIISGGANGADNLADLVSNWLDLRFMRFPAKWDKYHRAAGPIRNQQMLDEGKPDLVIAFHRDLSKSRGTKDMIARAKKAGIKVRHISK
jgi:hypothetical protein